MNEKMKIEKAELIDTIHDVNSPHFFEAIGFLYSTLPLPS